MPANVYNTLARNLTTVENKSKHMQNHIEWTNLLPTKPKLRTYVKFKENICTEEYVKYCTSRRNRSLMAHFRIGILPLHIKIGRFRDKRIEEGVCLIWNSGEWTTFSVCWHHLLLTTGKTCIQLLIMINMSNYEKFVFLLKFKWKYVCILIT